MHFSQTGTSTADLPLGQLMAPAVVIDVTRQAGRRRGLPGHARRRRGLRGGAWPDRAGHDRAGAHRLEPLLARPEALSGRRHARRRVEAAGFPVRRRRRAPAGRTSGAWRAWHRHGLDRLRAVHRLHRAPHRRRRQRRRTSRTSPALDSCRRPAPRHRAADEDRRRIGRAGAGGCAGAALSGYDAGPLGIIEPVDRAQFGRLRGSQAPVARDPSPRAESWRGRCTQHVDAARPSISHSRRFGDDPVAVARALDRRRRWQLRIRRWSSASESDQPQQPSGVSVVVSTAGFSQAASTGNSKSSSVQACGSTSFRSSASRTDRPRRWKRGRR